MLQVETILVVCLTTIAPAALTILAKCAIMLIVQTIEVNDQRQIAILDSHLAKNGWCAARDARGRPGTGTHVFLIAGGLVFAVRSVRESSMSKATVTYMLYVCGRSRAARAMLAGDH